ncbi:MAG: hypothetical protein IJV91_01015, partial [Kiritimatiellae bacterium]|nr:hypothetical protein [Kiritimatiellia bacterium]
MEFRYVARALLHFNADETRFENHLSGVNVFYVELCGHTFAIKEFKHFVSFDSLTQEQAYLALSHVNAYIRYVNGNRTPYEFRQDFANQLMVAI